MPRWKGHKTPSDQARNLYITAREFPGWAQAIVEGAKANRRAMNVEQWRDAHPIQDIANP